MSVHCTRREMLTRGTAAVALAATAPALPALAAPEAVANRNSAPSLPVAIQRCRSYEPKVLMPQLQQAFDLIGGIGPLMRGKTVTIKLNLTGGPWTKLGGLPAYQTYHVHPNFVAATCAAFHEAGANRIVLVESGYSRKPLDEVMADGGWDIAMINAAGGEKVLWEDTRNKGKWPSYSRLAVPWGGYLYPAFDLNSRYEKTDVFVSLAKLKDHANAGVTMAVKNLFGIAPTSIYGDNYDGARAPTVDEQCVKARGDTFHKGARQPPAGAPPEINPDSPRHWSHRVPRVTADLFSVRPVGSLPGGWHRNQPRWRRAVDSGRRADSAGFVIRRPQRRLYRRDLHRRDGLRSRRGAQDVSVHGRQPFGVARPARCRHQRG